jgi:hypothetical protein
VVKTQASVVSRHGTVSSKLLSTQGAYLPTLSPGADSLVVNDDYNIGETSIDLIADQRFRCTYTRAGVEKNKSGLGRCMPSKLSTNRFAMGITQLNNYGQPPLDLWCIGCNLKVPGTAGLFPTLPMMSDIMHQANVEKTVAGLVSQLPEHQDLDDTFCND